MGVITGMVAVVFMTLGHSFSEGVSAFEQNDYKAATQAFSHVLQTAEADSPYRALSLLWRAECLARTDDTQGAERDLDRLLEGELDVSTRKDAQALYLKVTGKAWVELSLSSPEKTWASIAAAVSARDDKRLLRCFTGDLLKEVTAGFTRGDGWDDMDDVGEMELLKVVYSDDKDEAVVTLAAKHQDRVHLRAVRHAGAWHFAGAANARRPGRGDEVHVDVKGHDAQALRTDSYRLQVLRKAIETYVLKEQRMPQALVDLKAYAAKYDDVSKSVSNDEPFVLQAPTRDVEQPASPWIFTSGPSEGKRIVLAFGSVREVPETEFQSIAKKHGLRLGAAAAAEGASGVAGEQIQRWIQELGHDSFDVRQKAYQQLEDAGEGALQFLRDAEVDDPEITYRIQKLLSGH